MSNFFPILFNENTFKQYSTHKFCAKKCEYLYCLKVSSRKPSMNSTYYVIYLFKIFLTFIPIYMYSDKSLQALSK